MVHERGSRRRARATLWYRRPTMRWSSALSASRVALLLGALLQARSGRAEAADPPASSAEPSAFSAFLEGQRAFESGDYLLAARAFESAYQLEPHPDVLWNAARAWDRAGEIARAANRYERYLREAPAGARDRDSALQAVSRLATKLGRIEVVGPGTIDIAVDEHPLDGDRVYVTPGAHVVRGRADARLVTKTVTVAAGEAVSVALVAERTLPSPSPSPSPLLLPAPAPAPLPATPPPAPPWLPGWRRGVAFAGLGATAISAGFLAWSGIDTLDARSTFTRERTPQGLEDGRAKQARTNALLATTLGLGAVTAAATIVLAKTARGARVEVSAAPSPLPSLSLGGRF
jgi:hypothetical protein